MCCKEDGFIYGRNSRPFCIACQERWRASWQKVGWQTRANGCFRGPWLNAEESFDFSGRQFSNSIAAKLQEQVDAHDTAQYENERTRLWRGHGWWSGTRGIAISGAANRGDRNWIESSARRWRAWRRNCSVRQNYGRLGVVHPGGRSGVWVGVENGAWLHNRRAQNLLWRLAGRNWQNWKIRNPIAATGPDQMCAVGEECFARVQCYLFAGPINVVAQSVRDEHLTFLRKSDDVCGLWIEPGIMSRSDRIPMQCGLKFLPARHSIRNHGVGIERPSCIGSRTFRGQ